MPSVDIFISQEPLLPGHVPRLSVELLLRRRDSSEQTRLGLRQQLKQRELTISSSHLNQMRLVAYRRLDLSKKDHVVPADADHSRFFSNLHCERGFPRADEAEPLEVGDRAFILAEGVSGYGRSAREHGRTLGSRKSTLTTAPVVLACRADRGNTLSDFSDHVFRGQLLTRDACTQVTDDLTHPRHLQ